jgi:phage terminase large subunit
MADATAESIKSLEGFRIAWIEEAQTLSQRSLSLLRPTIRVDGSQIWANWNPRRKSDAIDDFLRAKTPDDAIVVRANWRDNPWFPDVLDEERRLDLQLYPERYQHIWEGEYARAFEGAYFAKHLEQARQQGRIGHVAVDPVLPIRAFFDIGGAGHSSDAMAIWLVQFVGRGRTIRGRPARSAAGARGFQGNARTGRVKAEALPLLRSRTGGGKLD